MERAADVGRGRAAATRRRRAGPRSLTIPLTRLIAIVAVLATAACTSAPDVVPPTTSVIASTTVASTTSDRPSTSEAVPSGIDAPTTFGLLDSFWQQAYPAAFGAPFQTLAGGFQPLDSGAPTGSALCISDPKALTGNAFYCSQGDGIVYDTGVLIPVLLEHYGPDGLLSSLAHEFGHAVAARAGVADGPPLVRELQADCFAGVFLGWVASPNAPVVVPGNKMLAALAPLLDFGDQVGMRPTDSTAHGFAIDRAQAIRLGMERGAMACRDLRLEDMSVALARFDGTADRSPRHPSDGETVDAALASAQSALDMEFPAVVVADADLAAAHTFGDFAVATMGVVASARAAGRSAFDAGCLAGRWTAKVFGPDHPDQLGGRLSDPDEALNALRGRPDASTEEVYAFVDGFAGTC